MPYSVSNPPNGKTKNMDEDGKRQFVHVFNNMLSEGKDEETAFKAAYGVVRKAGHRKKANNMLSKTAGYALGKLIKKALEQATDASTDTQATSAAGTSSGPNTQIPAAPMNAQGYLPQRPQQTGLGIGQQTSQAGGVGGGMATGGIKPLIINPYLNNRLKQQEMAAKVKK